MDQKSPLQLVIYPHPLLTRSLSAVKRFDQALEHDLAEMFRLMYENQGIGLAGNQAGLDQRIIVMNLTGDPEQPEQELVLINPEIKNTSKKMVLDEEGCLSFPEVKIQVPRHESLVFSALDENGQPLLYEAEGLFARCFQHELDHINGITFVERLAPADRARISDHLKTLEAQYQKILTNE